MNDYEDDTAPEQPGASRPWLQMIQDAEKAFQDYDDKCKSIEKHYGNLKAMAEAVGDREFQIFWANLEVLRPTIYQRPPRPVIMPRHTDLGNVVREASQMLERALEYDIEDDDLHQTLLHVRDDVALSARGVVWVLDNGHAMHVERCDFLHEPARKWAEVGWVARRAYLTREQGVERFGEVFWDAECEEIGNKRDDDYKETTKKAQVWEIWSKAERKVVWVTEGVDEVLDEAEPLIDVKGFFPCPQPAYGTVQPGTLLPIPDFVYYRDQVDEINELTARISSLSESLRMKGFYAAGTSEIGEAIEAAMRQTDNKAILVPVSNFAALGGGNLKDSIVWLPVREIGEVITGLVQLRKQLIDDVYEITGLSDIMRGQTAASETATAQQLKSQYGSVRVREKQNEMVRIALDVLRLKAEIFAETLPAQEIMLMAAMQLPTMQQVQQAAIQHQKQAAMMAQAAQQQSGQAPQPEPFDPPVTIEQVDQLLKSQRVRPFLMEIESDSTIMPDEQEEKRSRLEFLQAMGSFIQQAGAMVAAQPESAPFAGELMKFAAGGFRAGRDLGGAIDDFVELVNEKAKAATQGQQGPSPEQIAAQAEQAKMQADMQKSQAQMQMDMQKMQAEVQGKAEDRRIQAMKVQADAALKRLELDLKAREIGIKEDDQMLKERQAEIDALLKVDERDMEEAQQRPVRFGDG